MAWKVLIGSDEKKGASVEKALKKLDVACERKKLETGDYWIVREDIVWCIIERKTYPDMYASIINRKAQIVDGENKKRGAPRYWDQATRMNATAAPYIFYMLVGGMTHRLEQIGAWKMIKTALTNIQMSMPKIHHIELRTEKDVPAQLKTFMELCKQQRCRSMQPENADDRPTRPPRSIEVAAVGAKRKAGDDPEQCARLMLATIHGVSDHVAAAVSQSYPGPISTLMTAYQQCSDQKQASSLLKSIEINRCGKKRKLGPKLSSRIHSTLCGGETLSFNTKACA